MTEIKFKAKRKDNNEWVYGNYFHNFRKGESHNIIDFNTNEWYEVNFETLCQYIGKKDKNGEDLYENDITDEGTIKLFENLGFDGGGGNHSGWYFHREYAYFDGELDYHTNMDECEKTGNKFD